MTPDYRKSPPLLARQPRIFILVVILSTLPFLFMAARQIIFHVQSQHTTGTIVETIYEKRTKSPRYVAQIKYSLPDNTEIRFVDYNYAAGFAVNWIGRTVNVDYDPAKPYHAQVFQPGKIAWEIVLPILFAIFCVKLLYWARTRKNYHD